MQISPNAICKLVCKRYAYVLSLALLHYSKVWRPNGFKCFL